MAAGGSASLRHIYAPSPATVRGKACNLGADPKGVNFLYSCGSNVVIRNLQEPLKTDLYVDHAATVTCAEYAPSGFYIASGDETGKVRIWDTVNLEHILKAQYQVLSGNINGIAWSADSERLVIVGEGRERMGAAIIANSAASCGSIDGHAKPILAAAIKPTRPFRCATAAEDGQVNFYEGPPFKYKHADTSHSKFVNCVRYSPDGNRYVSVGSDMKGVVFDGKTGAPIAQLTGDDAHTGSIYACAWSPDSAHVITVSADKTAKIWEMGSYRCVQTFRFGTRVDDMQMGCLWQRDSIVTVSLSGDINYLNRGDPERPLRVVKGHNKFATALTFDPPTQSIVSGGYDGKIVVWDYDRESQDVFVGEGHKSQVAALVVESGRLVSVGMDDTLIVSQLHERTFGPIIKLDSTPTDVSTTRDCETVVATCVDGVYVVRGGAVVHKLAHSQEPHCVDVAPDGRTVAVGAKDGIYVYTLTDAGTLDAAGEIKGTHRGTVTAVRFSPDGAHIASCDTNREVYVFERDGFAKKASGWCFHSARVQDLAWSPDGDHIVSGSVDRSLIVWSLRSPGEHITIPQAHVGGVTGVSWANDCTVLSCGQDSAVKSWNIKY